MHTTTGYLTGRMSRRARNWFRRNAPHGDMRPDQIDRAITSFIGFCVYVAGLVFTFCCAFFGTGYIPIDISAWRHWRRGDGTNNISHLDGAATA